MHEELKKLNFKSSNISSIAKIESNIDFVEEALVKNINSIKKILDIGFSTNNISSILSGSRKRCSEGITALVEGVPNLTKLIKETDFTASNISSILMGSGARCSEAITALVEGIPSLVKLIKDSKLKPSSIASALSGSGTSCGKAIENLLIEKNKKQTDCIVAS
ncbi:MAG: hypothetical protein GY694_22855 [Gammaproteobacteria bacterium]|nr:hypothetical protein [Gammaproteobacteria bacterium]